MSLGGPQVICTDVSETGRSLGASGGEGGPAGIELHAFVLFAMQIKCMELCIAYTAVCCVIMTYVAQVELL